MNKPLLAGDIKFWVEGWSADKREAPISFKYNENLLDLTWQFSIEVPDIDNYAFAKLPFKECRIYLNGEFICGGYAIRFSEGDTSYNCEFIGYGYQIAKLTLLQSIQGTLPTNMAIRDFLNLVISKNIASGKKVDINKIKVQDRLFSNIPLYEEFQSSQKSIRFYIYDPFDKGILPMDTYINIQKQSKKQDKETNLLEYCSRVLKPFNLFIKCLGKKGDLTGIIDESKLYPQKISEYSSKDDVEEFVLMLWQPNSNNVNATTFKSQSYFNKTEFNSTAISNFVLSDENSFDSLKTEEKTYATFGFLKYKITSFAPRAYNPLMSEIKNIRYINNSDDTTLFEKPKRSWDYSERYDTFVFSDTPDLDNEETKISPNFIYLKDNDVKDGTTFYYKMDNSFKSEAVPFFAAYDMSIRKAKSFKVSCKAIGFHHENTIKMLREKGVATNKNKTIFGVNQIVRLQSPQQYIDAFFLIDGVSMSLDSSGGCYTNLSLVVPTAYSTVYYDDIEMEKDIVLRLNASKKEQNNI